MFYKGFLLLLALFTSFVIHSYSFVYTGYNSLNGLSNDNVFQVVQDKEGFIWVATSYGLNKLGPNGIKKYYKMDGLYSNAILSLDIDKNGSLWIGTAEGLCVFENNGILRKYGTDKVYRPIELLVESNFIYWIDQSGILYTLNRKDTERKSFLDTDTLNVPEGRVRSICRSASGHVIIAAYNGIYEITGDQLKPLTIEGLRDSSFYKVFVDPAHNLWISSNTRIYKIKDNRVVHTIENEGKTDSRIIQLYVDKYSKVWYAGVNEISYSYMQYNDVLYNMSEEINNNSVVNNYFCDNNGDMWISTFGSGLYFIKNKPYQYFNSNNGLVTSYTTDLVSTADKLYIGTNTCFHYYSKSKKKITRLRINNEGGTEYIRNISRYGNNFIVSVASQALVKNSYYYKQTDDGSDSIWFFSSRYVYGDFKKKTVIVDHYDNYLSIYQNIAGTFKLKKKFDMLMYLGKNAYVNRIVQIKDDYYVCSIKGLVKCNADFSKGVTLLKNQSVLDIIEYRNMVLIAGELGIFIFDPSKNKVYNLKDFDNHFFLTLKFCVDKMNRLWVSTENGVYLYNQGKINHLGPSDGLASIHITNFEYEESTNIMWMSSYDGIIAIYLDQLENSTDKMPKFIIEEMVSGNNVYSSTSHPVINDRNIQLKTAFFNYQAPNHFYMRYKIDNSDWYYTNSNTLNISQLKHGDHTIILQASEHGYEWSEQVVFDFYVKPYWHERLLLRLIFLIGGFLAIFLLIYLIIKQNNIKANKKIDFEKHVIDLKLQALNAAINSHFVFNVLNAIQYFVSSNQQVKASKFIADFAKFMRIIIDNSNLTIVPIEEEVRRIHLYMGLEIMRFEDKLNYSIYVDPKINQAVVLLPNMIIQPFVENSILHGILPTKMKGLVDIKILDEDGNIHILIKDNGIGIDAARMKKRLLYRKSIGLKNVLDRLELFSKGRSYKFTVTDLSHVGEKGTLVDILIPKHTILDIGR